MTYHLLTSRAQLSGHVIERMIVSTMNVTFETTFNGEPRNYLVAEMALHLIESIWNEACDEFTAHEHGVVFYKSKALHGRPLA